jgi:hypothetical protein
MDTPVLVAIIAAVAFLLVSIMNVAFGYRIQQQLQQNATNT